MKDLDARSFDRLLSRRGCEPIRSKGGHVIYRTPTGETLVGIGTGRKTTVAPHIIRQAAKKLGVSIDDFLATKKGSQ